MDTVRFGIVGLRRGGRHGWMASLRLVPRARVVAVCDRIEARRREAIEGTDLGDKDAYADLSDMLARPDVDAVGVAVEPENNVDVVVQCLEAGKHVICEVPLTFTLDDCWRVVLAVERSGLTFAMAEQLNWGPWIAEWRKLYQEGALGKILYGEAEYIHGMGDACFWFDPEANTYLSWEEGKRNPNARRGRMWNLRHPIWYNPHSLTPLLQVLDERVVETTCMATRVPSYYNEEVPIPDLEIALMRTEGGAVLRIVTGFICPAVAHPYHYHHLLGTKGEVETGRGESPSGAPPPEGLIWLSDHYWKSRQTVKWEFQPWVSHDTRASASGHGGLDYYPLKDFVDAILDGTPVRIDVYRAADIAAAAIAAGQSVEQGSALVLVPDFRPGGERPAGEAPKGM
jgi:predicted dehydrogenase